MWVLVDCVLILLHRVVWLCLVYLWSEHCRCLFVFRFAILPPLALLVPCSQSLRPPHSLPYLRSSAAQQHSSGCIRVSEHMIGNTSLCQHVLLWRDRIGTNLDTVLRMFIWHKPVRVEDSICAATCFPLPPIRTLSFLFSSLFC